jgi:hypothetical protein
MIEIRDFAKSHITGDNDDSDPEQIAWRALYDSLVKSLHETWPDTMQELEQLEQKIELHTKMSDIIAARIKEQPYDFGWPIWIVMTIGGLILGWFRSNNYVTSLVWGFASFSLGFYVCVFVLNSRTVQSHVALFMYHKLHINKLSKWLYARGLGI